MPHLRDTHNAVAGTGDIPAKPLAGPSHGKAVAAFVVAWRQIAYLNAVLLSVEMVVKVLMRSGLGYLRNKQNVSFLCHFLMSLLMPGADCPKGIFCPRPWL